ncbi:MAG TPA: ribulokinase, partial [Candidatus Hydrogenedentes bacterium]|nr:ribulokinase [Candidatus Hydrogenedentota bacterium]
MSKYTLGIDYGTNSVRAVVVDCSDGALIGTHVYDYPTGDQGVILDPSDHNLARQNPADYVEGLEVSVVKALADAGSTDGFSTDAIIGIGVDTTGSTPLPVDASNVPLAMSDAFTDNPAAQAWLWKDHTSADEAARITEMAAEHRPQYIAKCGDTYSSEWFWSKIWKCLNVAPEVFDAAHSWVECADYIPAVLAGVTSPADVARGRCASGHKAMYC